MCDIKSESLKKHGSEDLKHNFETVKCKLRSFESLEEHYNDQVNTLGVKDLESVSEIWEDIACERKLRKAIIIQSQLKSVKCVHHSGHNPRGHSSIFYPGPPNHYFLNIYEEGNLFYRPNCFEQIILYRHVFS